MCRLQLVDVCSWPAACADFNLVVINVLLLRESAWRVLSVVTVWQLRDAYDVSSVSYRHRAWRHVRPAWSQERRQGWRDFIQWRCYVTLPETGNDVMCMTGNNVTCMTGEMSQVWQMSHVRQVKVSQVWQMLHVWQVKVTGMTGKTMSHVWQVKCHRYDKCHMCNGALCTFNSVTRWFAFERFKLYF